MTDKGLILLIAKGDRTAFEFLYKNFYKMAEWLITNNSGTKADAEDTFQDALVAFYEKTLQADFEITCSLKTYVYAIVRNLWLKKLRDQKQFCQP